MNGTKKWHLSMLISLIDGPMSNKRTLGNSQNHHLMSPSNEIGPVKQTKTTGDAFLLRAANQNRWHRMSALLMIAPSTANATTACCTLPRVAQYYLATCAKSRKLKIKSKLHDQLTTHDDVSRQSKVHSKRFTGTMFA